MTKKIVAAALIERDGKYFVAKRSANTRFLPGKWEFPGGKVEDGESEAAALKREITEEFNTLITVGKLVATTQMSSELWLHLYECTHHLGAYKLSDHSESAWLTLGEIASLDLAPADVDLLKQIAKNTRPTALHELSVGHSYTNDDIKRIFLVSGQGGMRKSNQSNSLVMLALHNTGNPYEDKWSDDGIMHYTGMGLMGDQSIGYLQNRTLAESRENGVELHLFESYESNSYIYRGKVELADEPYTERQKDESGHDRQVIKFPLRIKQGGRIGIVAS